MPATAGIREELVPCDLSQLNVPEHDGEIVPLKAKSLAQGKFGTDTRSKMLPIWRADLPADLLKAIKGINDATWWIANADKEVSEIGWPRSWVKPDALPWPDKPSTSGLRDGRDNAIRSHGSRSTGTPNKLDTSMEEFNQFARKAAMSPELAYLTMIAMMYRQSKDPTALKFFKESRQRVQGHLEAIDKILGTDWNTQ